MSLFTVKRSRTRTVMRVRCILADGKWHNLRSIARKLRCSTAGASARVRDLRKTKFGRLVIVAQPDAKPGPWKYRLVAGAR